jgi:hypothetical protein
MRMGAHLAHELLSPNLPKLSSSGALTRRRRSFFTLPHHDGMPAPLDEEPRASVERGWQPLAPTTGRFVLATDASSCYAGVARVPQ